MVGLTGPKGDTATSQLHYRNAEQVLRFGYPRAVLALQQALEEGLDTSADPPRTGLGLMNGATLYSMPSRGSRSVGLKIVTHNPNNTARGLPTVHGTYLHFDAETTTVTALMDGAALTTLRTPAVSVAAVHPALARFTRPLHLVIFGMGPQGVGHLDALTAVADAAHDFPRPQKVTFVTRRDPAGELPVRPGMAIAGLTAGDQRLVELLSDADVVVCASGSTDPLFDSQALSHQAVAIAIGTHEPHHMEVDARLCGRATVVVEDRETALRSCGEVISARDSGLLPDERLVPMADLYRGISIPADRPVLFSGGGMAWQDRVVADAIIRHPLAHRVHQLTGGLDTLQAPEYSAVSLFV